jgi:GDP-4-dehydro-6-deoxy-D-mannose reductase
VGLLAGVRAGDLAPPPVRHRARRARTPAQPAGARGRAHDPRHRADERARQGRAHGLDATRALSARVLVTGASGFAGRHLVAACVQAGDTIAVASRRDGVDLLDPEAARAAIADAEPDVVYHLAARAHVGASWKDPEGTLRDNLALTRNVLDAVRAEAPGAVVVAVSSSEVYGPPRSLPLREDAELRPQSPYAVSKAASDLLAGFYADAHSLRVIRARAFNHAGPGQEPTYAIASFARQTAGALEAGAPTLKLVTGRADTRRDYTDVRDVVVAYRLLAEHARPGIYTVASGVSRSAAELIAALAEIAGLPLEHAVDPALVRPNEVMELRGDAGRLRAATGWAPVIPIERTLGDAVADWRERIRAGAAGDRAHE